MCLQSRLPNKAGSLAANSPVPMALPKLLYLHVLLQVSLVLASSQCKSPMKGNVLLQMGILAHPPTFLPACQSVVALPTQAYMSPIPLLWHWIMDFYGFLHCWVAFVMCSFRLFCRWIGLSAFSKPRNQKRQTGTNIRCQKKFLGSASTRKYLQLFTYIHIYIDIAGRFITIFAYLDIFARAASLKKRFAYKAKWRGQPWRLWRHMTIGLRTEARFFDPFWLETWAFNNCDRSFFSNSVKKWGVPDGSFLCSGVKGHSLECSIFAMPCLRLVRCPWCRLRLAHNGPARLVPAFSEPDMSHCQVESSSVWHAVALHYPLVCKTGRARVFWGKRSSCIIGRPLLPSAVPKSLRLDDFDRRAVLVLSSIFRMGHGINLKVLYFPGGHRALFRGRRFFVLARCWNVAGVGRNERWWGPFSWQAQYLANSDEVLKGSQFSSCETVFWILGFWLWFRMTGATFVGLSVKKALNPHQVFQHFSWCQQYFLKFYMCSRNPLVSLCNQIALVALWCEFWYSTLAKRASEFSGRCCYARDEGSWPRSCTHPCDQISPRSFKRTLSLHDLVITGPCVAWRSCRCCVFEVLVRKLFWGALRKFLHLVRSSSCLYLLHWLPARPHCFGSLASVFFPTYSCTCQSRIHVCCVQCWQFEGHAPFSGKDWN